ncbi:MAG TPA: tetratricopeptide repeat protein, partial [Gemmatimonadales bacterium]|nr:tetratricopeptide repeat protein [Gemmatimonadales bacterium]
EGHTSLGFVSLFYDWDWATADREFRTAQRLDSSFTPALLFHGWYDIAVGHPDSAIADLTRARAMDPLSLILNARLANMLYLARRFDEAIPQARQALTLDPSYGPAHGLLAQSYLALGRCDDAASEAAREGETYGYEAFLGGVIAARCGRKQDAVQWIARLKARIRSGRYVSPEAIAIIYAGLDQRDSAFAWLDRAYTDRTWSLYTIEADPMLDGLRADPRFAALARRVGLP